MMQFHTILIISVTLLAFLSITQMIKKRRKRSLLIQNVKQEPRFGAASEPTYASTDDMYETEGDEVLQDTHQEDSLFEDVLLQPKRPPAPQHVAEAPKKPKPEEIICLVLLSKPDRPYVGYELLQSLLVAGLRFGVMEIFHRFEESNGRGKILFSVASSSEPGSFEINNMGAYSGKGLMMFLRLTTNKDLMAVFDCMLDTAKQLIEYLGGDILDDERKPLTPEKIQIFRDKITDFEQGQRIGDLFDA